MSLFGWSYPAGCESVPGDEVGYCEVCGASEYDCQCPACDECGEIGHKECYSHHGLQITQSVLDAFNKNAEMLEKEAENWRKGLEWEEEMNKMAAIYWEKEAKELERKGLKTA